jgi:hypothetical protein
MAMQLVRHVRPTLEATDFTATFVGSSDLARAIQA